MARVVKEGVKAPERVELGVASDVNLTFKELFPAVADTDEAAAALASDSNGVTSGVSTAVDLWISTVEAAVELKSSKGVMARARPG